MSGGSGLDPPTVGEDVKDKKAFVAALAQDAEAVADVKEAEVVGDDGPTVMNWTDFVVAYMRLCEEEINYILSRPRKPFESTYLYEDMIANSSMSELSGGHQEGRLPLLNVRRQQIWDRPNDFLTPYSVISDEDDDDFLDSKEGKAD